MIMDARIEVEGLRESLRALGRFSPEARKEAGKILRTGATTVKADAQGRVSGRPGGGSYPRRRGMIRSGATARDAWVGLATDRYPWALGAEFGAKRAWVFGRVTTQGRLRRRTFPVWRGNQFVVRGTSGPGWLVQQAIRSNLPKVEKQIADDLSKLFDRVLSSAGVPRG